jgi:hypothetical protein
MFQAIRRALSREQLRRRTLAGAHPRVDGEGPAGACPALNQVANNKGIATFCFCDILFVSQLFGTP